MAEGGGGRKITPSVYKGSEEVFDFICGPCSRLGSNSEAVDFCSDCSEYFCTACTTHHLKFGITIGHNVVKRSEAKHASQGKTTSGSLPTERCEDHNGELITTYCADHGTVACNTCVSVNHRSCDRIYYIPAVAGDPKSRRSIPRVQKEMSGSLQAIKETRQYLQRRTTMADDVKTNRLKQVDDRTELLMKHARNMKKAAVKEITKNHQETTDKLKEELSSLDKAEARITARMKSLGNADAISDSQVFVDAKIGTQEAEAARRLEQRIKSTDRANVISTFLINDKVDSYLDEVNTLCKVVGNKPFRPVLNGTYAIGKKKAEHVYSMKDCCEIPNGDIVVTDYFNNCIKSLDMAYKIVKIFKISNPWGICQISENEIAVTLTIVKKVQFVDIQGSWKMTKSFPTQDCCRGIALIRSELFVSCGGHPGGKSYAPEGPGFVGVYDMFGSLRRKIQMNEHAQNIFSVPYFIVPTNNEERINIVDKVNGVITFDRHGNFLSSFFENIRWAICLCSVDDANLLVGGKESDNILQITSDGQLVKELLSLKDGIKTPKSVFYSRNRSTVLVAFDNSDKIQVYKLTS